MLVQWQKFELEGSPLFTLFPYLYPFPAAPFLAFPFLFLFFRYLPLSSFPLSLFPC